MQSSLYDLSPLLRVMLTGLVTAMGPLLWVYLRHRRATPVGRLRALTLVTLFLTFDLVLFGAFTRLTDSGLGCPDWPGCYGNASPVGALADISAAQSAMPSGPVTHGKAWVEMVHRYLATGVGVLIIVLTVVTWLVRKTRVALQAPNPWWPTATLVWVCIQGAFGALTVTMKLFPAIVTLHLLGGLLLLALLAVQAGAMWLRDTGTHPTLLPPGLRIGLMLALVLLLVQAASGAWVSTNYAVLACTEFPRCQGSWWPLMDFSQGFALWRPLGFMPTGEHISFQALTSIHMAHRLLAGVTLFALGALAVVLWGHNSQDSATPSAVHSATRWLAGLVALQAITGISNVVLDWPLLAAVLHTGGAAALVAVLVWLLTITCAQPAVERELVLTRRLTE
jgi:cytochrome c oxidase assembly protein subunit 15